MEYTEQMINPRKVFSRLGFGLTAMVVVWFLAQILWEMVPRWVFWTDNALRELNAWLWLGNLIPLYVFAVPVFLLILRPMQATPPEKSKVQPVRIVAVILICFFFMYAGNMLGIGLSFLISGGTAENRITSMLSEVSFFSVLITLILGPFLEEFVFRKTIIDRILPYGEKTAVVLSALAFALFHQNLYQFFYGFGLGLLLGYLYVRSGKLWLPAALHMGINCIGGVLAPVMLKLSENLMLSDSMIPEGLGLVRVALLSLLLMGSSLALMGLSIAGLVLFCVRFRKAHWEPTTNQLPKELAGKTAYGNGGMITYIALCSAITIALLFV